MVDDPYKVLGIAEDASQEEIKKAYRRKAKEYHPDLHPNDPATARKMGEVNEAYDMLMNPEKYAQRRQQQETRRQNTQGYSQQGRSAGSYQGPGGWASDFGGFDFEDIFGFGGFYGNAYGNAGGPARPQAQPGDSPQFCQAINAINSCQYEQAIQVLSTVVSAGRDARWYYLSALANEGAGNTVQALDQIRRACQMEPNMAEYRQVLQRIQQSGQTYQRNAQNFNMNTGMMQRVCLSYCAAQLFCRFCCM